jgi:putative phosphotransacetylase
MIPQVVVELSNRHIHLSEETRKILFGEKELTVKKYLTKDKSMYAAEETVILEGPRNRISNVRILGPIRKYTQVELLRSDCFALGVKAPLRDSGDLENAAPLKIIGPAGTTEAACGIIARRHLHIAKAIMDEHNLKDKQIVSVRIGGERGLVFDNVLTRISQGDSYVLHIDLEEGNAAGVNGGALADILV